MSLRRSRLRLPGRALAGASLLAVLVGTAMAGPNIVNSTPRYRACGRVSFEGGGSAPAYASRVSCTVARAVVRGCRSPKLRERACFGQLGLPSSQILPSVPRALPLGFRCYQAFGAYAAGLPPITVAETSWILCGREVFDQSRGVVYQLVAFWSSVT
jgi:hypothetical protein